MAMTTRESFDAFHELDGLLALQMEDADDEATEPRIQALLDALGDSIPARLAALSAVARQADAQSALSAAEVKHHQRIARRSKATSARCRATMLALLESSRDLTGEAVVVHEGSRYSMRSSQYVDGPADWRGWPEALLVAQDPKPDKSAAKRLLKAGGEIDGVTLATRWRAVRS